MLNHLSLKSVFLASALTLSIGIALNSNTTFRLLNWEGELRDLHYREKGEIVNLNIQESYLSRQYTYSGRSPLEFFKIEHTNEGPLERVLLSTELSEEYDNGFLLLTSRPNGDLAGRWFNHSFSDYPAGSIRFLNLSRHTVALELESSPNLLPPDDSLLYTPATEANLIPLRAATAEVDGEWKLFHTLPIRIRNNLRVIIILRDARTPETRESGPVEMLIIYDHLKAPSPL